MEDDGAFQRFESRQIGLGHKQAVTCHSIVWSSSSTAALLASPRAGANAAIDLQKFALENIYFCYNILQRATVARREMFLCA